MSIKGVINGGAGAVVVWFLITFFVMERAGSQLAGALCCVLPIALLAVAAAGLYAWQKRQKNNH